MPSLIHNRLFSSQKKRNDIIWNNSKFSENDRILENKPHKKQWNGTKISKICLKKLIAFERNIELILKILYMFYQILTFWRKILNQTINFWMIFHLTSKKVEKIERKKLYEPHYFKLNPTFSWYYNLKRNNKAY